MDTEEKPAKPEGVNSEAAQPAAPGLKVVESYTPRLRSGAAAAGLWLCYYLTGVGGYASLTPMRLVLFSFCGWCRSCCWRDR